MYSFPYICLAQPSGNRYYKRVACLTEKEFEDKLESWNRLGSSHDKLHWMYYRDLSRPIEYIFKYQEQYF